MDDPKTLLTTSEVARRLRRSVATVRAISARDLPYVQLEARGRRAYDERDVARYLEARTVRA
jgi:hypothetical protein